MIYVLAGVDGTGKSTLFNKLKEMLPDAIFIKESYTPSVEERMDRVSKFKKLMSCGRTVIYDRATVCDDFVYQPVKANEKSKLYETEALELLRQSTVIYLECDVATSVSRLEKRGDDYVTADDIPALKEQYELFFETNGIRAFRIDASYPENIVAMYARKIIARKSFKVAQIVPVQCLPKTIDKGYHMCLSNIVAKNDVYAKHFAELAKSENHWVLMDNGAAEGEQLSVDELIACYQRINPQEVVLPDTLLNGKETIQKSKDALKLICDFYDGAVPFTFMAVPQGATLYEWKECACEMVQWPEVKAIGISKFLQMETGDLYARERAVRILDDLFKQYNRYDIEVHLLGCSESPAVIDTIRRRFPFVRGCDSAYAYICTQAGVCIHTNTTRPLGEIDFINGNDYDGLEDNMQAMELETGAYNNKFDGSWK